MGKAKPARAVHALSEAVRRRAADPALPPALRLELETIAGELDRHARFEARARTLVLATVGADSIAEVSAALDELHAWALGRLPLHETGEPD
jgi:hypothetical protein